MSLAGLLKSLRGELAAVTASVPELVAEPVADAVPVVSTAAFVVKSVFSAMAVAVTES